MRSCQPRGRRCKFQFRHIIPAVRASQAERVGQESDSFVQLDSYLSPFNFYTYITFVGKLRSLLKFETVNAQPLCVRVEQQAEND